MPLAPLVIVNPVAGGGRAARLVPWLSDRLATRADARIVVTRRRGDAEALVGEAAASHDRIVVAGGDGTVQEVVNGILAADATAELGVVPVGSGNDLARTLGLPGDPGAAWTVALGATTRRIDLGRAESGDGRRWFASVGGIGFDGQVAAAMAQRRVWQRGRPGYLATTLVELRRFQNRTVTVTVDGERTDHEALLLAVANGAWYGGGMWIAPDARVDDGFLDLCIVGNVSRLTALRQLANLYRGTHIRHPAVSTARGRSILVAGGADAAATRVHLEGEPWGRLPVRFDVVPGRLAVAVAAEPHTAVG
jgi:diacylglycerol kinase (ATP)